LFEIDDISTDYSVSRQWVVNESVCFQIALNVRENALGGKVIKVN